MEVKEIENTGRRYNRYGLWLLFGLFCIGMVYESVRMGYPDWCLAICAIYSLISLLVYGRCWVAVAKNSSANMVNFYLAGSLIRMVSAVGLMAVYCIAVKRYEPIHHFLVFFLVFYFVMLTYNVIFFANVEKNSKKDNQYDKN